MSGAWEPVTACALCRSDRLEQVLSLGLIPLVNAYRASGIRQSPETLYPHELLRCAECGLAQLGISVDPETVFDAGYPYASSSTRALRDNFADLALEVRASGPGSLVDQAGGYMLLPTDLVVDIGGNDGNLLSNFVADHRTLNVTPEDIGQRGAALGIKHLQRYWTRDTALELVTQHGLAKVICATNVFAHIPDPHDFLSAAERALAAGGLLVIEVQYLIDLLSRTQYDHLYVEHRYFWTLTTLCRILEMHGLEALRVKRVDTHGGSLRVYACRKLGPEQYPDSGSAAARAESKATVRAMLEAESEYFSVSRSRDPFKSFATDVRESRRELWELLGPIGRVVGIGAPSRAGTLVNFCGLDEHVIDYICETPGSPKIGKSFPGTAIPVVDESRLYEDQPSHALILAWHIAEPLMKALRDKGYRGKFIVPLPTPQVIE